MVSQVLTLSSKAGGTWIFGRQDTEILLLDMVYNFKICAVCKGRCRGVAAKLATNSSAPQSIQIRTTAKRLAAS